MRKGEGKGAISVSADCKRGRNQALQEKCAKDDDDDVEGEDICNTECEAEDHRQHSEPVTTSVKSVIVVPLACGYIPPSLSLVHRSPARSGGVFVSCFALFQSVTRWNAQAPAHVWTFEGGGSSPLPVDTYCQMLAPSSDHCRSPPRSGAVHHGERTEVPRREFLLQRHFGREFVGCFSRALRLSCMRAQLRGSVL